MSAFIDITHKFAKVIVLIYSFIALFQIFYSLTFSIYFVIS